MWEASEAAVTEKGAAVASGGRKGDGAGALGGEAGPVLPAATGGAGYGRALGADAWVAMTGLEQDRLWLRKTGHLMERRAAGRWRRPEAT